MPKKCKNISETVREEQHRRKVIFKVLGVCWLYIRSRRATTKLCPPKHNAQVKPDQLYGSLSVVLAERSDKQGNTRVSGWSGQLCSPVSITTL